MKANHRLNPYFEKWKPGRPSSKAREQRSKYWEWEINKRPNLFNQEEKILRLSLKKQPFEVMVSGEKKKEYRRDSQWIWSRLVDKNGERKQYDYIEFTNGYGKNKPNFLAEYQGFSILAHGVHLEPYSTGFDIGFLEAGTIVINLGPIIQIKNYDAKH